MASSHFQTLIKPVYRLTSIVIAKSYSSSLFFWFVSDLITIASLHLMYHDLMKGSLNSMLEPSLDHFHLVKAFLHVVDVYLMCIGSSPVTKCNEQTLSCSLGIQSFLNTRYFLSDIILASLCQNFRYTKKKQN